MGPSVSKTKRFSGKDAIGKALHSGGTDWPMRPEEARRRLWTITGRYAVSVAEVRGAEIDETVIDATGGAPARKRLILRIDAETGYVSGDVFTPEGGRTTGRLLGDRDNWTLSFFGKIQDRVALSGDVARFVASCELVREGGGGAQLNAGATVEILCDDTQLLGVRIGVLEMDPNPGVGWRVKTTLVSQEIGRRNEAFRRIALGLYYTPNVAAVPEVAAALKILADPSHGLGLRRTLLVREKIVATVSLQLLPDFPGNDGSQEFFSRVVPHVAALERRRRYAMRNRDGYDWGHCLVFEHPNGGPGPSRNGLEYGEAHGLGTALARFNSRVGAVLNIEKLAAQADEAPLPPGAPHAKRIAYIVRFIALHELGHLLNMPHPWQRSLGHKLLGPSRPDALTWTNYSTRYPFGNSMAAHLDTLPNKTPDQKTARETTKSDRRKAFHRTFQGQKPQALAKPIGGYDGPETLFLRHAPFDEIAQGGKTFLDAKMNPPTLREPKSTGLGLALVAPTDKSAVAPLCIKSGQWNVRKDGVVTFAEYPWLPLRVYLTQDGHPIDDTEQARETYFDLSFGSGAVELLVRLGERSYPDPWFELPPTFPYSYHMTSEWPQGNETPVLRGRVTIGQSEHDGAFIGLPVPWISKRRLEAITGKHREKMNIQCVYHIDGSEALYNRAIRSNILSLDFTAGQTPPAELEFSDAADLNHQGSYSPDSAHVVRPMEPPMLLLPGGEEHPVEPWPAHKK